MQELRNAKEMQRSAKAKKCKRNANEMQQLINATETQRNAEARHAKQMKNNCNINAK